VGMFSFVGPCRQSIPYSSQGDYRHRGHIGHHSIFPFGGNDLSSGYRNIWHTSDGDDSNFLCAHIVGSLRIGQYLFSVRAVRMLFYAAVHILRFKCHCLEQVSARQKVWREA
jgi:hypothetical protein